MAKEEKKKTQYSVVGIKPKFTSKKGNEIMLIHVAFNSDGVLGHATDTFVVDPKVVPDELKVNDLIHISFGWNYRVSSVEIIGK